MKRNIIINFYKLSSILRSEYLVDETINALCEQIEPRFIDGPNADSVCELDKWLYFYAWEIVGQLSLSKPMGFTKAGADHSGMMDTAEKAMDYFAVVGQIPALDKILAKNPLFSVGPPSWEAATRFCFQHTMARQQDVDQKSSEKRDMLDNFLELKKTVGLDDYGVVGSLMNANILAKLRDELDNANLQTPISFATATKLPYLEAIILESCRMHPGVTLLLERVVPEPGLQLPNGTFLPPGTKVGMNAWVVHQNKAVFGQDAASFGPERWLQQDWENDQEFAGRLANMKRSFAVVFHRNCKRIF
ncbi:putative Pisatin demethylase [Glarea lozoyensis 74030]|uniref:Putative Pisatin demethylase n=1 Tax=Glarea lozoyensis (strain ATCC 74030 / MF5533) TaxID=1104152 RepID=H0EY29_GLAL7|nr:putative Pisatin demethylase [Glarea lozoyensis 74030]